jgi:hypothetical protein
LALFFLGGPAALGLAIPVWRHLLVPGGLLLGSLAIHPLLTYLMRCSARSMRQEDMEKHQPPTSDPQGAAGSEIEAASRRFTSQPEGTADRIQGLGSIRGEGGS